VLIYDEIIVIGRFVNINCSNRGKELYVTFGDAGCASDRKNVLTIAAFWGNMDYDEEEKACLNTKIKDIQKWKPENTIPSINALKKQLKAAPIKLERLGRFILRGK
jgi:hypothetical protein